jgi:hypothetical protein
MYLFIMYKRSTTYRQYDARKQIRIIIFVLPCFYVPVIVLCSTGKLQLHLFFSILDLGPLDHVYVQRPGRDTRR